MRKPEHSAEPSIEEILASIRSIIAEDGTAPRPAVKPVSEGAARRPAPETENLQDAGGGGFAARQGNPASAHGQKPSQSATADGGDEILELTEDFMLAEPAAAQTEASPKPRTANQPVRDFYGEDASGDFRPVPSPEEEELDEVLSNLAAEVERLAAPDAVQKRSHEREAEHSPADKTDERQDRPDTGGPSSFGAPEFTEPDEQSVGQPQIAGIAEPKTTTAPAGTPPPAQAPQPAPASATKSKPVWSARRLEQTAPSTPGTATASGEEQAAPPEPPQEQSAKPSSPVSRRDLWAEGVQMPVPDTGPEMPLPLSDGDSRKTATDTGASRKDYPAVQDDRRAVGSFLTRVFGSTAAEQADNTAADETSLRGKAEKLARDTISDFAEEKLNAPAVGDALKADKDFMNEVASSLESALASSDEGSPADLPEYASGSEAEQETPVDSAKESGLDIMLKKALAADAQTSEAAAAEQEQKEDAPPTEVAAAIADGIAHDEIPSTEPAAAETDLPEQEAPQLPPETFGSAATEAGKADLPAPALNLPDSLEGSIKEMIKPLIIQWLNENLPRIVEETVREELTVRSGIDGLKDRSSA